MSEKPARTTASGSESSEDSDVEIPEVDFGPLEPLIPFLHWFVHGYFRAEIEGLEELPDNALLVGNHSGGFGSVDSAVFYLSFLEHYGTSRPLYWLAHEFLVDLPVLGSMLQQMGVVTGRPEVARAVLRGGGSLVVYPGGEPELHRRWTERNEIQFHGRQGFLRLARDTGAPLVPVVAHGGHNTYLPLVAGRRAAKALRLDKTLNIKTLPVALSVPWGVEIGGFLPHIPLPARIRVRILPPMHIAPDADLDVEYERVVGTMQATLDELATGS